MIKKGVPQSVTKAITGHKTNAMFERYNIVNTQTIQNALSAAR
jgi:hypothetical protein